MDAKSRRTLANLIRSQRVASLGTLQDGSPLVSMVLYAAAPDFSSFLLHISRLALHTRNILADARVSLLIAEPDAGVEDPQTLARLSILGEAVEALPEAEEYADARGLYLERFPQAGVSFQLGDFHLFRVRPGGGRFVAGFGRIFDVSLEDLKRASAEG